jgi:hypothetical protein
MRLMRKNDCSRQDANLENKKMSDDVFTDMLKDEIDLDYCDCAFPVLELDHPLFCQGCAKPIGRLKPITAENLFDACRRGEIPPCPKCGRAGFIEDDAMVIFGVCPECKGKGRSQ